MKGRGAEGGVGDWHGHLGACHELLGFVGVDWPVRGCRLPGPRRLRRRVARRVSGI